MYKDHALMPDELPVQKWWVFFVKSDQHRRWWYHLIPSYRPPFQHVYAGCEANDNLILYIDPQMNSMAISLMMGRPAKHIDFVTRTGGRCLYVEFPWPRHELEPGQAIHTRGCAITCASVISYAMGLDCGAVTPKGLFDVLLSKYGAKEVTAHVKRRRRRPEQTSRRASSQDPGR